MLKNQPFIKIFHQFDHGGGGGSIVVVKINSQGGGGIVGKKNYLQKNPWGKLTQKPMFYTPVSIYFVQILICRILQMRGHPWRIYLEGAL